MTRVAAVQMVSSHELEANLARAGQLLQEAAASGAALAVLPENFAFMGQKETDKLAVAEPAGQGPIQEWLARQARELGLWLVGGSIPLQDPDSPLPVSACLVFDAEGRQQARYDKLHLFDVDLPGGESYRESNTLTPGRAPVTVDTPFGRLGLAICYDLRFPELFRHYAEAGAEILTIPSAFTRTTGQAHWDVLVRARAIENLAYVIAPNQGGQHSNGRATFGASQVVDPWGQVMGRLQNGSGVVLADLDPALMQQHRSALPALRHRRL
ncbi:MAG: carbon-nitrogen hydrolase family protein [Pseudomonadota bacterium]|uniref:carbon-nitrogen hydrolase family protein n=1 Tax=Thermithiobacillus tepidarius TaxID=929 RepID=UPI000407D5FE|nr:carbon-nitrogen hydrolase family protein [Thermithiobacillus tepidarius]